MNRPFRILIADKNRHVREFLRREFREEGYRVQVAKDSQEVTMMIDVNEPPDLLILDLEMPLGDALDVLEWLQARLPPLPVVVAHFSFGTAPSICCGQRSRHRREGGGHESPEGRGSGGAQAVLPGSFRFGRVPRGMKPSNQAELCRKLRQIGTPDCLQNVVFGTM